MERKRSVTVPSRSLRQCVRLTQRRLYPWLRLLLRGLEEVSESHFVRMGDGSV